MKIVPYKVDDERERRRQLHRRNRLLKCSGAYSPLVVCSVPLLVALISGAEILLITSDCLGHKLHNAVMLHKAGAYIIQPCLSIYRQSAQNHKYESY